MTTMPVEHKLFLSKWIRAQRGAVYAAWTRPEIMRKWFCPRELKLVSAEADVRVGGRFYAVMSNGEETHTVRGIYREVVPDRRLVFSHQWQEGDAAVTVVTVEFFDQDGGTLVSLTHEGFRDQPSREGHIGGWQSTLESLREFLLSTVGATP